MNNNIYYIIAIFVLFSIALSPVLAEESNNQNKVDKNLNSYENSLNNIVVVKAGTISNNQNNNDQNSKVECNNSTKNTNNSKTSNKTDIENAKGDVKPKKLTQAQILKSSVAVNKYVSKYKKLPNKVKIGNYNFSISEYTYLISKTIHYKYKKKTTPITIKYNIKNPKILVDQQLKDSYLQNITINMQLIFSST